jgi:single-strand DNA-binding protein
MQVRNSITLIGNLGSAPKTSKLPSGRMVTEFSLATNDYYRDKNGDRQTRTDWHKIKAYGKLAETFDKYLEQGSQVCIAGALRYSKWVDKHDQVRTSAEIVADSFTFLSGGKQQQAEADMEVSMASEPAPAATPAKATSRKTARRTAKKKEAVTITMDPTGADLPF